MQVDSNDPGEMTFHELNTEGMLHQVGPVYRHAKESNVANLCWLEHLHLSNRDRLYSEVCKVVLSAACPRETEEAGAGASKVPFEIVAVAPDGRCGWRSILAAHDVAGYRRVPRTWQGMIAKWFWEHISFTVTAIVFFIYKYIYIDMYMYTYGKVNSDMFLNIYIYIYIVFKKNHDIVCK